MSALAKAAPHNAGHRHWQQGTEHARKQQWLQAAQAFGRATRAAPGDALYWINLAHAQHRAGALPRAVAAAKRALQISPGDPIALRLLGDCQMQLHRYDEAAQAFAQLEDNGAEDVDAMVQHGAVLQSLITKALQQQIPLERFARLD